MKKVFAVAKVAAIVNVFLFFTLLFTTCGGGAAGGAGGASIPDSEYSTHNAGGWGGGGSSGGSGGSGSGGNGVNMTGGTPLFVERYEDPVTGTFAGSQLNDLIAAIQNNSSRSNSVFNIPFYVVGDPVVRQARVTKGRTKVEKFEHQYKATCSIPPSTTTSVFYYYVEEGINLASITTAEMTGWQCQEDGSVHNGSHITNITGDVSLVPVYASGAGPINGGVIRTDLHTGAVPAVGETFDYQTLAATTVSGSVVYITIPPITSGTVLYQENGSNVSAYSYSVHFNIDGTTFAVTFAPGDTQAKVIENIPLGANISTQATIEVSGGTGYTELVTESASLTAQAGGGTTMYVQYPLSCSISDLFPGAAITGYSYPTYYTNNGTPTDITSAAPTPSYTNPLNPSQTYYFAGWATSSSSSSPAIAGNLIPADGTYKGALNLYAVYSSCSVSINQPWTNVIAEDTLDDHLNLSATSTGFSSPVTYTWSVENQNANTAVAVDSSTGLVTIVPGKTGTEIVKVTATDGTYTATNTISISVEALSLPAGPIVLTMADTGTTINTSLLAGYTGGVDYSWQVTSGSSVNVPNTNSSSQNISVVSAGKSTISVIPTITDTQQHLATKTIDVYVLDLKLNGDGLTTAGNGYALMTTMNNTSGTAVSAYLDGLAGMLNTTFTWALGTADNSSTYLDLLGSANDSRTIKPKADGAGTVTVSTSCGGVTVSKTINVSVVGLSLTEGPIYITEGGNCDITASVPNYGSGVNYDWDFSGSSVTTVGTTPADDNGEKKTLGTLAGGKSTITVMATLSATNTQLPQKSIDVYVVDMQLSCNDFLPGTNNIVMTSSSTDSSVVTASLNGPNMPPTTFTWTVNSNATDYIELDGTDNDTNDATDTRTVKPKAAGTDKTFTVTANCGTVTVSKTINVNVAGISVPAGPIVLTKGGSGQQITAEVIGDSNATISWEVPSSPNIVTISPTSGNTRTITPLSGGTGGKTTLTLSTNVNDRSLSKSIDVYVLDLTLSGSTGAGVVNSTDANIDYDLIMNAADTTGKELTASLAGFTSGVTYTWTQPSPYATLNSTNGAQKIIQSTGTAGSTDFTLTASITGVAGASITKTIKLKAAGITIGGPDYFAYNETGTYNISTMGDVNLGNITFSELNDTENVAEISQTGAIATVTAAKGGTYTIKATAVVSGTTITVEDTKPINILKLDVTGLDVSPSNTELPLGQPQEVTAVLTGAPDPSAVTYTWEYTGSDLILSTTIGSAITVIPMSGVGSSKTLTVTATMNGTDYGPVTLGVLPKNITAASLPFYLDNLPPGDPDNPTVIPAIDFEQAEVNTIKDILRGTHTYIDLSATTMPSGVVDGCFSWCPTITTAPSIPEGVTSMRQCFDHGECTSHLSGPSTIVIPASVTDMYKCFFKCTALQNVRIIVKANITDASKWAKAFMHITSSQNVTVYVTSYSVKNAIISSSYSDGGVPNSESNAGVSIQVGIPAGY